ncbi:hypothetical protein [Desulfitobacterium sp.]|nr:hypothetical protein [Desulfitobacterium sp.]MEA4901431.1 hypothetical protein [Desulfitobacterium sp.]
MKKRTIPEGTLFFIMYFYLTTSINEAEEKIAILLTGFIYSHIMV